MALNPAPRLPIPTAPPPPPEPEQVDKAAIIGHQGRWEKLKLTPVQLKQWNETRTSLLWSVSSFADIWYAMMVDPEDGGLAWFTDQVPIAATDDTYMYLNPATFFAMRLEERVFVCCHEIGHAMFGHCTQLHNLTIAGKIRYPDGVALELDNEQFQIAMDLVLNDMLVQSSIGAMPLDAKGEPMCWHDPATVNMNMSVLDAYRKIYKKQPQSGGGGKGPPGGGKGAGGAPRPFDKHLTPGQGQGKTPGEAASDRNEQAWKNAINAAIHAAKTQGKLPLGLERLFTKVLEPVIDWTEEVRTAIVRKAGQGGSSWDRLDAELLVRGFGAPGRQGFGAGTVVCAYDTSGSIDQPMMDRFGSEVGGILDDVRPKLLIVTQCDAAVHEWVECADSDDLRRMRIRGGGGTDFRPVFDRIDEEGLMPDMLIYFTDGYGTFPSAPPPYPVIWASITEGHKYPWGQVIYVPLKKQR